MTERSPGDDSRLAGVDPTSRSEVWIKKLVYPMHTVPTAMAPVIVGMALAAHHGVFALVPALAVFVFAWLVQLGGVLADNYFNLRRYRNDQEHPALVYALDHGVIRLESIRSATVGAYVAAAVVAVYLVLLGGLPVILVGLASIAVSLFYSLELTDIPFHDLYFFLFFGPVSVGGAFYMQAVAHTPADFPLWLPPDTLPVLAIALGIPIGAITTAILVVDNIRDLDFDRDKNDPTLAVIIGESWSRVEYYALLAIAYVTPSIMWWTTDLGAGILLPLLSIPYAGYVGKQMAEARSYRELLPMSPSTGKALLLYASLLAVGLVI